MIYLDNASTMPIFPIVLETMVKEWEKYANPGGIYKASRENAVLLEELRAQLSKIWGLAQERQIIFTSSASESNTMLANNTRYQMIATEFSHPSIKNQPNIKIIKLENLAHELEYNLANGPRLFSISSIQHETGIVFNLEAISEICKKYNCKLHIDAAQAKNISEIVKYADFITVSSHKLGGPIGIAALITTEPLKPLIFGGMQEKNMRAGTQAIPLVAAFVHAVKIWHDNNYFQSHFHQLKNYLKEKIECKYFLENNLKSKEYIFSSHIICLINDFIPGSEIAAFMDMNNIAIGIGSACMTGALNTMQTLQLLEIPNEMMSSGIRISFSGNTKMSDLQEFIDKFNNFMKKRLKQ